MKLTLHELNRIRSKIEKSITLPEFFRVVYIGDSVESLEPSQKEFDSDIAESLKKSHLLVAVRNLIASESMKVGVSDLLTQQAVLEKDISRWENRVSSLYRAETTEDLERASSHKTKVEATGEVVAPKSIHLVFNGSFEEILSEMRDELERLSMERSKINFSTIVEIPDDVVEGLRSFKLVK